MNKVLLLGNLGNDAELKVTQGGASLLKFSVATSEKWTDKAGVKQEKTAWHNCTMFGDRAEKLAQYLTKGTKVLVEGAIDYQKYEKDGETKYFTAIKVFNVEFAGGKKNDSERPASNDDSDGLPPVDDDQIPF